MGDETAWPHGQPDFEPPRLIALGGKSDSAEGI